MGDTFASSQEGACLGRSVGSARSRIAPGGRTARRIGCRRRSRPRSSRLKREYPGWGAPKIREKLRQQFTGPHLPAISTVHAALDRHNLVKHRRRRRPRATGTELSRPTTPNALWCADYKGEFLLGNRRYCYPLTITDFASRYLLTCEALLTTQETFAFTIFERTFKEFGLPRVIRTDNGVPFASAHAIYGLSKLSVRPRPATREALALPRQGSSTRLSTAPAPVHRARGAPAPSCAALTRSRRS